jgi:maltose O-acetyltransferase
MVALPGSTAPMPARVRKSGRRVVVHVVNLLSSLVGDDVVSKAVRRTVLRAAGATIPTSSDLHGGTWFSEPRHLHIGDRCFVNRRCYLDLEGPIHLGDDVVVGHGTTIVTSVHQRGPSHRRAGIVSTHAVVVESGVWIGANATVLPGTTIGAGSIIAAGAVVRHSVPPDHLAAGVPAHVRPLTTTDRLDPPPHSSPSAVASSHHEEAPPRA